MPGVPGTGAIVRTAGLRFRGAQSRIPRLSTSLGTLPRCEVEGRGWGAWQDSGAWGGSFWNPVYMVESVCASQRLSGVATCQVPDSECSSDRATGCRNALALHEFTWYLVCAWQGPGSKADQPAPKERGGRITEVQTQICRASWGKLKLEQTPASAAVNLPPTTGRPPQSALLGVRSLLLLPTPPACPAWAAVKTAPRRPLGKLH